jgi:predicted ArsR family transcriptional regulator
MEFSSQWWPSHRKGFETRVKIIAQIKRKPGISLEEISQKIKRSPRQTKRHLTNLFLEGFIYKKSGNYYLKGKTLAKPS